MDPDRKPAIYICDDEETNLILFRRALAALDCAVRTFGNGEELFDGIAEFGPPDLILTDVMMPKVNGYQVCERIKSEEHTRIIPIILVTGLNDLKDKVRGLEAGADDFLGKPFHPLELRARVRSLLRVKRLYDEVEQKNSLLNNEKALLEALVRARTAELEALNLGLVSALEKANTLNDTDTGNHIRRVCAYSEVLARGMGLPEETVQRIGRYASLHDVGKVGIPDRVLKKPGKLTPEEFDEMKRHATIGFEILKAANADQVAQNIAWCHHEKFDGTGYPQRLAGEDIPIEARIVTLADVFDALTTRRCYKEAFSEEVSLGIINKDSGTHFDPSLVAIMMENLAAFQDIRVRYADPADGEDAPSAAAPAPSAAAPAPSAAAPAPSAAAPAPSAGAPAPEEPAPARRDLRPAPAPEPVADVSKLTPLRTLHSRGMMAVGI